MPTSKNRLLDRMVLALMLIALSGSFVSTGAQALPEAALLPDGKGDLLWYNHSGFQNGEGLWAKRGQASPIGHGWIFTFVF